MKMCMMAVFDKKTACYNSPFFARSEGDGLRIVQDAAAGKGTTLGRHPADFAVYLVGMWDDSGLIVSVDPPRICGEVLDLLRPEKDPPLFDEEE